MRTRMAEARVGDERGAIALMAVLSLVAIFGFVALTVDGGSLLALRRRLVATADSAALAAALSFALQEDGSQCGVSEDPPMAQADFAASANLTPAIRAQFLTNCTDSTVTVRYQSPTKLYFAPVLGFDEDKTVSALAVAKWGAAGAGHPAPIMFRDQWLKDCGIDPFNLPSGDPPAVCTAWLNNNPDQLGDAQWSFLNLCYASDCPNRGWDVPKTGYTCPNPGSANRRDWILSGSTALLPMHYPQPTYVCGSAGHAAANFDDLRTQIGKTKAFPVNCETPNPDPDHQCAAANGHGQVDKNGVLCPPPCSQPDKYDIVGFVPMRIDDVLRGDDPLAIGQPFVPDVVDSVCIQVVDFSDPLFPSVTLDDMNATGCPNGRNPDVIENAPGDSLAPYVYSVDPVTLAETAYFGPASDPATCQTPGDATTCNYDYDPATHGLTWIGPFPTAGVHVRFQWDDAGQPEIQGKCGQRSPDPNAVCLEVDYHGLVSGGGAPGGGANFGLVAIGLVS